MTPLRCILLLSLLGIALCMPPDCGAPEPPDCDSVYKKGGAPAVLRSRECASWVATFKPDSWSMTTICQSAVLQGGGRKYQEDRVLCDLDVQTARFPDLPTGGVKVVNVGIMAVFDGHIDTEASAMASKLLAEYFALHTRFLLNATYSGWLHVLPNIGRLIELSVLDESYPYELLRFALQRTIQDIVATFSKDPFQNVVNSCTTASVILMADDHILVANVGASKAFLCSEAYQTPDAKGPIDDVHFKSCASVTSVLEVTDWQPLTADDSYLIAASGVFEKLTPQNVCEMLCEPHFDDTMTSKSSLSCSDSLANCIVNAAVEKGSMNNLAATVLPLKSLITWPKNERHGPRKLVSSSFVLSKTDK